MKPQGLPVDVDQDGVGADTLRTRLTRIHPTARLCHRLDAATGGLVLAASWGAFHFISRGVGLELWNGVSCMIFSLLAGVVYVRMKKRFFYAYALIAVGYLL